VLRRGDEHVGMQRGNGLRVPGLRQSAEQGMVCGDALPHHVVQQLHDFLHGKSLSPARDSSGPPAARIIGTPGRADLVRVILRVHPVRAELRFASSLNSSKSPSVRQDLL
jgi:hypothetical protein